MPPRLRDPHAGPDGAALYIEWWGDALYRDWCSETGVEPIGYRAFCDLTLKRGKDWWADGDAGTLARPAKRAREHS